MANEYHYSSLPKAIPGFITLTLSSSAKITISLNAIAAIRRSEMDANFTSVSLLGGPVSGHSVLETHEEVVALIHQAQHPAS